MTSSQLTTLDQFHQKLKNAQNLNLIISVSRDCVLQCEYCYAIDPDEIPRKRIIKLEHVEKIIQDAFQVRHKHISFEWTGGEALLAGQGFYEKVLEFQEKYKTNDKTYENVIQTSGGIYNETFFDFLIDNNFHIGITIDGPRDIHEAQRPTKGGSSSFDRVLKSYHYIKSKQGRCGVLCTMTKNSLGRVRDIIDFYDSQGIKSWHSNPYVYDPRKPIQDQTLALKPSEYAEFFKTQFDQYIELDDTKLRPNTVRSLMHAISGISQMGKCTHGGRCLTNFINFDDEGNATFCPKFLGYEEFRLGHIKDQSINEMLSPENPLMRRLIEQRLKSMHGCESDGCDYLSVCNSGCPYDSFLNGTDGSIEHRDYLCPGKHSLYSHVEDKLQGLGVKTINSVRKEQNHIQNKETSFNKQSVEEFQV